MLGLFECRQMSWFANYLNTTDHRAVSKWLHYFEIYEREFAAHRQRPIRFLEIGIFEGGSVPMWKTFFAPDSKLVFVDINPACQQFAIEGTTVEIGDQSDPAFLAMLAEKYGPFDIVVDDGSHLSPHQIASFEGLWAHMADRGIYLVEDCHTSYWPGYGGGFGNEASFVSFAKRKVDAMHSVYTDQHEIFPVDPIYAEMQGVRFYDSITIIEKRMKPKLPTMTYSVNGKTYGSHQPFRGVGRSSVFPE